MKPLIRFIISILINNIKLVRFRKIGWLASFGSGLQINGRIRERIIVGKRVRIGKRARLGNSFNQGEGIVIGDSCFIGNDFTAIDGEIIVGESCLIADDVSIVAGNHQMDPTVVNGYMNSKMLFGPVKIGKSCWIGEKVVVLPGVSVGEYSIIGAGSIVTKSIPSYSIAVGNPAKAIKKYDLNKKEWISCI